MVVLIGADMPENFPCQSVPFGDFDQQSGDFELLQSIDAAKDIECIELSFFFFDIIILERLLFLLAYDDSLYFF